MVYFVGCRRPLGDGSIRIHVRRDRTCDDLRCYMNPLQRGLMIRLLARQSDRGLDQIDHTLGNLRSPRVLV